MVFYSMFSAELDIVDKRHTVKNWRSSLSMFDKNNKFFFGIIYMSSFIKMEIIEIFI